MGESGARALLLGATREPAGGDPAFPLRVGRVLDAKIGIPVEAR